MTYCFDVTDDVMDNGSSTTRTRNLQPSVKFGENLRTIVIQMRLQDHLICEWSNNSFWKLGFLTGFLSFLILFFVHCFLNPQSGYSKIDVYILNLVSHDF